MEISGKINADFHNYVPELLWQSIRYAAYLKLKEEKSIQWNMSFTCNILQQRKQNTEKNLNCLDFKQRVIGPLQYHGHYTPSRAKILNIKNKIRKKKREMPHYYNVVRFKYSA